MRRKAVMYRLLQSIILLYSNSLLAINVAITIDDYPLPDSALYSVNNRTERFIEAGKQFNCRFAFFCVGQHARDRNDDALCKRLSDEGHYIANHSMNHQHLSSMSLSNFEKEIIKAEQVLQSNETFRKWFRYPYLDYGVDAKAGGSKEKLIGSFGVLTKLGYKEGYVTINTFDWFINTRLQKAVQQNKTINYDALRRVYLSLLDEWMDYYVDMYQTIVPDKEIVHVLLLHDNDLNALYLPDLLHMIQHKGWMLTSPEQAFNDVSWRTVLLEKAETIRIKPASLSCDAIDQRLADDIVFE